MTGCSHPFTIQGGDRPPGVFCDVCGAKIERKAAAKAVAKVDRTISAEGARIQALKISLARQSSVAKSRA